MNNQFCSICLKEESLFDFAEGTTFTDVEDKTYCVKCMDDIEDDLLFCERCCKREHRNEHFEKHFVMTTDAHNQVIYYHVACLREYELCIVCKTYLKNTECVGVFIDYHCKIECCHAICLNDKDMCDYCGISLRVKCESCNHRFRDCYNPDCKNYGYDAWRETGRYDGQCDSCNW